MNKIDEIYLNLDYSPAQQDCMVALLEAGIDVAPLEQIKLSRESYKTIQMFYTMCPDLLDLIDPELSDEAFTTRIGEHMLGFETDDVINAIRPGDTIAETKEKIVALKKQYYPVLTDDGLRHYKKKGKVASTLKKGGSL